MKRFGLHVSILALFVAGISCIGGAQTVGLSVDVPFQFNVGERVLPAGHYLILAPQGDTLRVLGPNGTAVLAMANQVSGNTPSGVGIVDFNCYANRCFLSQVWSARTDTGKELLTSRTEQELARRADQVAVIALRATPHGERQENTTGKRNC
jgi:hypothetical protein